MHEGSDFINPFLPGITGNQIIHRMILVAKGLNALTFYSVIVHLYSWIIKYMYHYDLVWYHKTFALLLNSILPDYYILPCKCK